MNFKKILYGSLLFSYLILSVGCGGANSSGGNAGLGSTVDQSLGADKTDLATQWKSYRATYTTVSKDGKTVCTDATDPCSSYGARLSSDYKEPTADGIIPQVMAWSLLYSNSTSNDSSLSKILNIPIFADRGTLSSKGGTLVYDFQGPVHVIGWGTFTLEEHLELSLKANGNILLNIKGDAGGEDLTSQFELKKVPGTDLHDGPAGMTAGLVAVHETARGQSDTYQGLRCEISYTPNSNYLISTEIFVEVQDQKISSGSVVFADDSGLLTTVTQLWNSTFQVKNDPHADFLDFYGVYGMKSENLVETPVIGSGMKAVTNNAPDSLKSQLQDTVDNICAQAEQNL